LNQVLIQIAHGVDAHDDPIQGPAGKCVRWHGDITKENQEAVIRIVKPRDRVASVTYVNRVTAFLFASEDSFKRLMNLPNKPLKMGCGDQRCVCLHHASLGAWTFQCSF